MHATGSLRRDSTWSPLLTGERAAAARAVAAEIAATVAPPMLAPGASAGLAGGAAGVALLVAEARRADAASAGLPAPDELLRAAADRAGERQPDLDLWTGEAGIAFALTRLRGPGASAEIDRRLIDWVSRRPVVQFDLIVGVVGAGVQALELVPEPPGPELLARVVEALGEAAERDSGGLAWREPSPQADGPPRFNAGVAHGTPGVAAFLAGAVSSGHAPPVARDLLEGALAWTLEQRMSDEVSVLPWDVEPGSTPAPARLAWCYGDAGGALAVLQAADALGDAEGRRAGEEIAVRAAERDPSTAGCVDAGLCHGAAGLGHLLGRAHALTGEEACARAGRMWLERALEMRDDRFEVAGFPAWIPDGKGRLKNHPDPGMLGGAAGVGLALLAACRAEDPGWDRALLASHRFQ